MYRHPGIAFREAEPTGSPSLCWSFLSVLALTSLWLAYMLLHPCSYSLKQRMVFLTTLSLLPKVPLCLDNSHEGYMFIEGFNAGHDAQRMVMYEG